MDEKLQEVTNENEIPEETLDELKDAKGGEDDE